MTNATITLKNISQHFVQENKITTVLHTINICFMQEISYAITGASGSGKSTLLHIIAGINTPMKGDVHFNTISLNSLSDKKKALHLNRSIGIVFQSSHVIKELSVIENIMLPALINNNTKADALDKALLLLNAVGLQDKQNANPKSLSGGQQQRLGIARALINNPQFLIADEPTGNLDYNTGQNIINLLLECQKKWNLGLIISSHDPCVINRMQEEHELINGTLIKK